MGSSEEKREHRRIEILSAAKEAFSKRGYHAASISQIIERAGIARGTFYLYFESKESVFEAILDQTIDDLRARIIRVNVAQGAAPPAQQLHDNVSRVLQYMLDDRPLIQLLLNPGLAPGSELSRRVVGFFNHVETMIESSLSYGMAVGLVRSCDSELTAAQILGAIRGALRKFTNLEKDFDVTNVAEQLIDFSLHGVLAVKSLDVDEH